jgi:hypothetical protein
LARALRRPGAAAYYGDDRGGLEIAEEGVRGAAQHIASPPFQPSVEHKGPEVKNQPKLDPEPLLELRVAKGLRFDLSNLEALRVEHEADRKQIFHAQSQISNIQDASLCELWFPPTLLSQLRSTRRVAH